MRHGPHRQAGMAAQMAIAVGLHRIRLLSLRLADIYPLNSEIFCPHPANRPALVSRHRPSYDLHHCPAHRRYMIVGPTYSLLESIRQTTVRTPGRPVSVRHLRLLSSRTYPTNRILTSPLRLQSFRIT